LRNRAAGCRSGGAPPIVLKAARLFDSVSGKLLEHGMVVVSGTKIQAVGSDVNIPTTQRSSISAMPRCCPVHRCPCAFVAGVES